MMNPFDPILDQPQSIEYSALDPSAVYPLANHDICFTGDAKTNLSDLFWPWADAIYARHIHLHIRDPQSDEFMSLVTRYYPGYQEAILGNEGVIISKRLVSPLSSSYDRGVLWLLECQAEGDRLLRLEVEIDWGESLTQRMVDGLLVAQRNPGRAQGIYAQHNAESTRIFGSPQSPPTSIEMDDAGHARLTYYVLVNGIVEVPLILTLSDVGEQVAWNGFLALRDAERAFHISVEAWSKLLQAGRLWTSDPRLNRAVQEGKLETVRNVQRLRTGLTPAGNRLADVPMLVNSLDILDITQSRNLLAHVRRVAEQSGGRLPEFMPTQSKAPLPDPGPALADTNGAYLAALHLHLQHHFDADLLAEHYTAAQACSEQLVQARWRTEEPRDASLLARYAVGLRHATALATLHRDGVNMVRWESEACEVERKAEGLGGVMPPPGTSLEAWADASGWRMWGNRPWSFDEPLAGVNLAGEVIWAGCGLQWKKGDLWVYPRRANSWGWWALLDLPTVDGAVSLVWDGVALHSTRAVHSDQPVQLHKRIRALNTDEDDFDLLFELTPVADEPDADSEQGRHIFRPVFIAY